MLPRLGRASIDSFRHRRTQSDHRIHEPLQNRAKDIPRRGFARSPACEVASGSSAIWSSPEANYSRFVLTGAYANLGQATGRVVEIIQQTKLPLRDDYFIENYVNDPRTTPEDQLITEILIPTI